MATIAFIGLGNMGAPMAANLLRAGHAVTGFDLSAPALDALRAAGGTAAPSVPEAVRGASTVVCMLPSGRHVRAVVTEALPHLEPGALLVDCSTIDVSTARELSVAAAAQGFAMLDAPVSGGVSGATAGTLTFMVGGEAAAFEAGRALLANMGRTIVHAGGAGAGQAAKVCNNLILGISMLAVSEGFALADKLGLPAQALFDISSTASGQCWALTSYCPVPGPVPRDAARDPTQLPWFASTAPTGSLPSGAPVPDTSVPSATAPRNSAGPRPIPVSMTAMRTPSPREVVHASRMP